ncbi:hypothetical protein [Trichormus sp. NMC-1]|nr:hypothetical protein [Trichormus sp. NMC-1]
MSRIEFLNLIKSRLEEAGGRGQGRWGDGEVGRWGDGENEE